MRRGNRAGRRIERLVEEEGAAARRQRAAARLGPFPLGSSRLVEMKVHVDEPGKHVKAGRVDLLCGALQVGRDLDDAPLGYADVRFHAAVRADERAAADDGVNHDARVPAR